MLVSISAVNHRTNRMKDPMMTMPGSSWRWLMRLRIRMKKRTASAETVTAYGKSLISGSAQFCLLRVTIGDGRTMVSQLPSVVEPA